MWRQFDPSPSPPHWDVSSLFLDGAAAVLTFEGLSCGAGCAAGRSADLGRICQRCVGVEDVPRGVDALQPRFAVQNDAAGMVEIDDVH